MAGNFKFTPVISVNPSLMEIAQTLNMEIANCEIRFLDKTSKWLNELYFSLDTPDECMDCESQLSHSLGKFQKTYRVCRLFFKNDEFQRCAFYLKDMLNKNPIIDFIHYFALFKSALKIIRENESDWNEIDCQKLGFDDMVELKEDLTEYLIVTNDCYMKYLYGIVLRKLKLNVEAEKAFIAALNLNPNLWAAWIELADVYQGNDVLPDAWMRNLFDVKYLKRLHNKYECDIAINYLFEHGYQTFIDLKVDLATINEEKNNSVYSLELFDEVYEIDPYRTDYFTTLSNIYYIQENHQRLSHLAKRAAKINRYSPEACCVLGNLHSLRGEHDKAVLYFQRSLKLDPNNSSTLVLAAHEYSEIENYNAAARFYSRAIDIDPRNHKALYSLGQLYEVFKIHKIALSCYERAYEYAPHDSRILVALGSVYEEQDRLEEAKVCYYRAYSIGDVERTALFKLGRIYDKLKDVHHAAASFNLYVSEVYKEGFNTIRNLGEACRYLANYHVKYSHNYEQARFFAHKCTEIPEMRIEGEEILRQLTMRGAQHTFDEESDEQFAVLEPFVIGQIPRAVIGEDEDTNQEPTVNTPIMLASPLQVFEEGDRSNDLSTTIIEEQNERMSE